MKRFLNILGIVLALSVIVTSCEKAPFLTLSTPKTINFSDQGGTQSITFAANRDWSVSSSDSWCRVSPSSGNKADGDISVTLTCEPNTTYDPRNATITVKVEELSEIITVTQDTNLGLIVSPTSYDLSNAAQTIEVGVRANVKYTIEIEATCKDWVSQTSTRSLSTEKILFSIAANESYDNRDGKITVKLTDGSLSETILIKQSQTDGLFIVTPEYTVSRDAQTIDVEVQSNIPFDVESEVEWIHYVETRALTSSSLLLTIDANDTYYPRQGLVKVIGKEGTIQRTISIKQEQTDALFITDESKEYLIASAGGTIHVNVFHNIDFDVETESFPEWLSYTIKSVDTYNSQVSFSVNKNKDYIGREVSLTIKGKDLTDTFSIIQHQVDIVYVDTQILDFAWNGTALPVRVYSNVDYSIDKPSWISTEQSATADEGYLKVDFYTITPEENLDVEREGLLTIMWKNEGVESTTTMTIKQNKWVITLNEAGGLIDIITNDRVRKMKALTLAGEINGTDVLYIRRMEQLSYLNLYETRIVEGGVSYASIGGETCYSSNDLIGSYMFLATDNFRSLKEVILPSTVSKVGFWSFYGHNHLAKLTIPESVKVIDRDAFGTCFELQRVDLPSHLEVLDDASFYACNISEITLPPTLKKLGQHALSCPNIIVHIKSTPSTLSTIGYLPFGDADKATVYVPKGYLTDYLLTPIGDYVKIYEE